MSFPIIVFAVTVAYFFIEATRIASLQLRFSGPRQPERRQSERRRRELFDWKDAVIRAAVSLVTMSAAIFIVLSPTYSPQDKHWAYGTLGTILGYWLKPSK